MNKIEKYCGIIPAFYACYDENGKVSPQRIHALTQHFINKGVLGVYVCGSSGECIYQSVEERKAVLENVVKSAQGKLTIIAHVAANNTADSCELAAHAESLKVDAIACIPPIYFHLPDYGIAGYWNDISAAAPNTDFIIYNIPQLAGVALNLSLYEEMLKNPRVIGVKNSSMPVLDIAQWKAFGGKDRVVFNGPDEQYFGGRVMGADGGIGGTYGVMPALFVKLEQLIKNGELNKAKELQTVVTEIVMVLCSSHGNIYAVMKEIMRRKDNIDIGGVRKPLVEVSSLDEAVIAKAIDLISKAEISYL